MSDVITGKTDTEKKVDQKQTQADWQTTYDWPENMTVSKAPAAAATDEYWTVKWDPTTNKVVIN